MRRRPDRARPTPRWSRARLLVLLAAVAIVAVLLVAGLVLALLDATSPPSAGGARHRAAAGPADARTADHRSGASGPDALAAARDALASRPMPVLDPAAARPGPLSTRDPGAPIVLPPATGRGPAGVPTGFPHSPAGALAQLAALDTAAMQPASLPAARAVIAAWALPGGPSPASWSGVKALASLLGAAQLAGGGSAQLALVVTPLMGMIKGTVGPDFVLPCVDFEFDATLQQTARVAAADCQRMVWVAGRWLVGAGPEPAPAPSVWPDTDAALAVGYRDLRRG